MESMDELVSRLQSMFPSIEGDVIGVVLNESDRNLESAIEKLLWLSNEEDTSIPSTSSSLSASYPSQKDDFPTLPKSQETPIIVDRSETGRRNQQHPPRRGSEHTTHQKQQVNTAKPSDVSRPGYLYPSSYYNQPATSYQAGYGGYYYSGATQPLYGGLLYAPWLNPEATTIQPSDKRVSVSSGQGVGGGMSDKGDWPSSVHLEGVPSSEAPVEEVTLLPEVKESSAQVVGGAKRLIMLRGLPGSGKSTLARELVGITGIICSTDDFFIVDGQYLFDPSKLGENHEKNKQRVREALLSGISPVVIDNTNTAAWEMKPYVIMAQEFGYEVEIHEPDTPWKFRVEDLARRNSHQVPRHHLEKMLDRYEHNVTVESILASNQPERKESQTQRERISPSAFRREGYKSPPSTSRSFSSEVRAGHQTRQFSGSRSPGQTRRDHPSKFSRGPSSTGTIEERDSRKSHYSRAPSSPEDSRKPHYSRGHSSPEDSRKPHYSRGPSSPGDSRKPHYSRGPSSPGDSRNPHYSRGPSSPGDSRKPHYSRGPSSPEDSRKPHYSRGFSSPGTIGDSRKLHTSRYPQYYRPPRHYGSSKQERGCSSEESSLQKQQQEDRGFEDLTKPSRTNIHEDRGFEDLTAGEPGRTNIHEVHSCPQISGLQSSKPSIVSNRQTAEDWDPEFQHHIHGFNESMPQEGDPVIDWATILQPSADNHAAVEQADQQECPPPVHFQIEQQEANGIPCEMSIPDAESTFLQCTTTSVETTTPRDILPQEKHSDSSFDDPAIVEKGITVSEYRMTDSWPDKDQSDGFEAQSLLTSILEQTPEHTPPSVSADSVGFQNQVQPHPLDLVFSPPQADADSTMSGMEMTMNLDANSVTTSSEAHPIPCTEPSTESYFPSAYFVPVESSNESSSIAAPLPNATFTIHATASESNYHRLPADLQGGQMVPSFESKAVEPELEDEISNASNFSNVSYTSNVSNSSNPSSVGYPGLKSDMYVGTGYCGSETYSDCEPDSDLGFLMECFPDLGPNYLKLLYQKSDENVEETVSHALLSSVNPVSSPQRDLMKFHFPLPEPTDLLDHDETSSTISSVSYTSDYVTQACMTAEDGSAVDTTSVEDTTLIEYLQIDDKELIPFGTLLEEEGIGEDLITDMNECINDEEIARLLQEQLNLEAAEEQTKPPTAPPPSEEQQPLEFDLQPPPLEDRSGMADENLLLKLTPSLAMQLENMFGPVKDYLPLKGEVQDEDLVVLLSERAARGIYQKWIDTLIAKNIEYRVQSDLQVNTDAALALELQEAEKKKKQPDGFGWQDRQKKQRHNTTPLLPSDGTRRDPLVLRGHTAPPDETSPRTLREIVDEQLAEHIGGQEASNAVRVVCHDNMAQEVQLQNLYRRFPQLDEVVIHKVLVKNRFDFKSTATQLEQQCDTTDGNTTSQGAVKPVTSNTTNHRAGTTKTSTDRITSSQRATSTKPTSSRKHKPHPTSPTKSKKSKPKAVKFEDEGARPSYDDLRAEAALHAKMRAENFQKAAHARSKKQGEVALYYAQQGHMHTEKMNEANQRAADLILRLQNDPQSANTLDLHGLHVNEALKVLEMKLTTLKKGCFVYVITGRGIHSKGKEARLKPAVLQYLQQNGYNFEEPNPGMLKVGTRTSS